MLFNSNTFLLFLSCFLLAYYMVRRSLRWRNILIVAASYLFYGWWDYRFLALIIISSLLDYGVGLRLVKAEGRARRGWLALSVCGNLGILGFFKYYDFFSASLEQGLAALGVPFHPFTLHVVLPVGISFYTFQTMSYTLDIYRGQMKPTRDLPAFMAYVAFFPQLVAGPIERAERLLPQFLSERTVTAEGIRSGLWLMLWGMFKKVVIADNVASVVDLVYGTASPGALAVIVGTLAFGVQIYCDFSGYSDIARGVARLLGFELMLNFDVPYRALDIREFWRRWHISLSTWLRDYLYIPLGGSRHGPGRTMVNLFLTMLLGGLWHGAAWHFVVWGIWHGMGLGIHRIWHERGRRMAWLPAWMLTQCFVLYGWLLFRAESLDQAAAFTVALGHYQTPVWLGSAVLLLVVCSLPLVLMQIAQVRTGDLMVALRLSPWRYAALVGALLLAIVFFWQKQQVHAFIYFQF